jgi:hypothetical protein
MHSKEHSWIQSQIAFYLFDKNINSFEDVNGKHVKMCATTSDLIEEATSYTFFPNIFFSILG